MRSDLLKSLKCAIPVLAIETGGTQHSWLASEGKNTR
jgi:hypothetical protein